MDVKKLEQLSQQNNMKQLYPVRKMMRITKEQDKTLKAMAKKAKVSESEIIRRLLK